jgi:mannose-6-phosphate isomerase-like protein (cupin superfamily)
MIFSRYCRKSPNMKIRQRLGLSILLSAAAFGGLAARSQTDAGSPDALSKPQVFLFEQLQANRMANGGESRNVIRGALPTGENVAVHESVLPVGAAPTPLHRIQHSEFISVREGTVAFEHDGKSESVGPGGVIYVAFGTLHALKNVGNVPAKYCVVAIGGDIKK